MPPRPALPRRRPVLRGERKVQVNARRGKRARNATRIQDDNEYGCAACGVQFRNAFAKKSHADDQDRMSPCFQAYYQQSVQRPAAVAPMIIRRRHAEANLVGDDEGDGDSEIDDSEMYEFQEDRHGNNVRVRRLVVASDSDDLEDEGEPEVEYDDLDADYTGENIEFDQAFHARIDGRRPEGDVDWWNEAGDETWFCTDKNIQGSNPESEHWPFPTYSHAMLYGWLTSGGCPITQAQLDRLLVLLQDPKFKPNEDLAGVCDSRSFFRQSEKLLPIVKRASETVPSKVVTKVLVQKTGHAAGGQQVRVVKRELAGTRRIEGVSITSHIKRAFATPSLRRKLLTTAYDDPGDNPPTQFNQTPFCREPKKYTNLRSFHHRLPAEFGEDQGTLQEFHIDDVVRLASGKVMRIDDLCYRAPNLHGERSAAASARGIDVFPALVASGPLFRPSLDGAEYTCAYDTVIQSQVSDIISKVQVCGPGGGAGIVVNSQTCADGIRSAYVPKRTPLGLPGGGGVTFGLACTSTRWAPPPSMRRARRASTCRSAAWTGASTGRATPSSR